MPGAWSVGVSPAWLEQQERGVSGVCGGADSRGGAQPQTTGTRFAETMDAVTAITMERVSRQRRVFMFRMSVSKDLQPGVERPCIYSTILVVNIRSTSKGFLAGCTTSSSPETLEASARPTPQAQCAPCRGPGRKVLTHGSLQVFLSAATELPRRPEGPPCAAGAMPPMPWRERNADAYLYCFLSG